MADRVFVTAGDWGVASDGIQWSLQRRKPRGWCPVSFVRSTRDILARCMREKGVDADTAAHLLAGLPTTFDEWKALSNSPVEASEGVSGTPLADDPENPLRQARCRAAALSVEDRT